MLFNLINIIFMLGVIATSILVPIWIRKAKYAKLTGKDMNKRSKKEIPELGGICVIAGFLTGILAFIFLKVFVFKDNINVVEIFAIATSLLIATIIGLVDDILGWKIGLRKRYKILLTFAIALPIMVINAGNSDMAIPFIGNVDVGLIYPLLLIPIGIMGSSNGFNMLAGLNGLESGMGVIVLTTMGILVKPIYLKATIFLMVFCLLAFLIFNWYPARIFPGDTLTYSVGALIGIAAIMGDIERAALIIFIPYFIEFFLKLRGRMRKESFLKPGKKGLELPYKNIYSLTHLSAFILSKFTKPKEYAVVMLIYAIQIVFAAIALIIYM